MGSTILLPTYLSGEYNIVTIYAAANERRAPEDHHQHIRAHITALHALSSEFLHAASRDGTRAIDLSQLCQASYPDNCRNADPLPLPSTSVLRHRFIHSFSSPTNLLLARGCM